MSNPSHDVRPIYTIDSVDRIVFVNPTWLVFVRAEEGIAAARNGYIGRPVWELLGEGGVRLLWEVLYRRVRAIGAPVFVPMRVDAPDERRLVDIELRPLADRSIQHICERVWSEARPAVALLDPAWPRDERTLRCCSWRQRIRGEHRCMAGDRGRTIHARARSGRSVADAQARRLRYLQAVAAENVSGESGVAGAWGSGCGAWARGEGRSARLAALQRAYRV